MELGKSTAVLYHGEAQNLRLNVVVQELVPLNEQMVLDLLVFSNLVSAVLNLLSSLVRERLQLGEGEPLELVFELRVSLLPLVEGRLQVAIDVGHGVVRSLELVLNQFSDAYELLPPVPDHWQNFPVFVLRKS